MATIKKLELAIWKRYHREVKIDSSNGESLHLTIMISTEGMNLFLMIPGGDATLLGYYDNDHEILQINDDRITFKEAAKSIGIYEELLKQELLTIMMETALNFEKMKLNVEENEVFEDEA